MYNERNQSRRKNDRNPLSPENNMERFRVAVGHRDRVKPGNLVGAIANESGLNGRMIGRIQIFDNYSLIDLPKGIRIGSIFRNEKIIIPNSKTIFHENDDIVFFAETKCIKNLEQLLSIN